MFIARALQRSKGSVGDAAELLGMHRNTITRKITEYRIKRSRDQGLRDSNDSGLGTRGLRLLRIRIP